MNQLKLLGEIRSYIYQIALNSIELENPKKDIKEAQKEALNILLIEKLAANQESQYNILGKKFTIRTEILHLAKKYMLNEKRALLDVDLMLFIAVSSSGASTLYSHMKRFDEQTLSDIDKIITLYPASISATQGEMVQRHNIPALLPACLNTHIPMTTIQKLLDHGANPNQYYSAEYANNYGGKVTVWHDLSNLKDSSISPERFQAIEELFSSKVEKEKVDTRCSYPIMYRERLIKQSYKSLLENLESYSANKELDKEAVKAIAASLIDKQYKFN